MKFMKLGSKPDSFQSDGDNVRFPQFPLLSKSARLQKSVTSTDEGNGDEVDIHDIPGGPVAFEICAKFCYSMTVTLNAYNVVAARCAAEYLGMHETIEKGNLIYKVDVFLNSSLFHSWKDSITVLQTTKSLLPWSEELKLVCHCVDAIASKATVDVSMVDWSYTYNRKKLPEENGNDPNWNSVRNRMVPKDWWVEDLCELEVDLYKQVITNIKNKGIISGEVLGETLKAYTLRRLSGFSKGMIQCGDMLKARSIVDVIVCLLPAEKGSVSCSFLLKLLKAASLVNSGETDKRELVRRIGQQLEAAYVSDLLIQAPEGEPMIYDVEIVRKILEEFMTQDQNAEIQLAERPGILTEASKLMVAKLVDGYLVEIAKDPNLPLSAFVDLAEMVSGFSRPAHDSLYRAIDTYLKEHPGMSKSERKRICKLMDCKKLSVDACMHAAQNERLPLRVVVQVLFFEQVRAAASSGSSTPDLPKGIKDLSSGSHGSSRSATTNTDEDWDAVATAEELKALKAEVAALRLGNERNGADIRINTDKAAISKMKGMLMSKKIFSKIWSGKAGQGDNSGSDSSESRGSAQPEEAKSTPARNWRHSVS
ncbi:BTB/POZ domain-containing protein NPY2-like [Camellia sinensis]|uniref:BTB/POZ domain-containing protein NPY2-like n=1 Tax=Camellia sinensis TaxID=4442 RepID=UPI0010361DBB|nr:BTB/POZ domain-containing protein NPY2-like [Camellia sinensis]